MFRGLSSKDLHHYDFFEDRLLPFIELFSSGLSSILGTCTSHFCRVSFEDGLLLLCADLGGLWHLANVRKFGMEILCSGRRAGGDLIALVGAFRVWTVLAGLRACG